MGLELKILLFGTAASLATCVGIGLLIWKEKWAREQAFWLNSFAAGVVVAAVFLHLLPEALKGDHEQPLIFVLAGFIIFYLLENVLIMHPSAEMEHSGHAHERHSRFLARSPLTGVGLLLHCLIDGIILGVGFKVSNEVGLLITLGVVMHEFPEGIAILSVLFSSGIRRRYAVIYSVVVAFATTAGAALSLTFLERVAPGTVSLLLAVGVGTFLYVAASDLVPAAHAHAGRFSAPLFIVGVAFLWVTAAVLKIGHVH